MNLKQQQQQKKKKKKKKINGKEIKFIAYIYIHLYQEFLRKI